MTSSYAPFPSRGSSFKLKKVNLLSNVKILTEKVYCIKNSDSSEDLIDAVNSSILEVLTDADKHLTEGNDLFIVCWNGEQKRELEENFKEMESQSYTCNNFQQIPVKTSILYTSGNYADIMKQLYWARITLRDMEKDYTVNNKSGK